MTMILDGTNGLTFNDATTQSSTATNASNISSGTLGKARLPTGSVLQVVNVTSVTYVSITNTSETATGYSASITPTSSSSKILVSFYCSEFRVPAYSGANILLYKNGSVLTFIAREFGFCPTLTTNTFGNIISSSYLDSPATTSSVTYAIYARILANPGTLEFLPNGSNNTANKNLTITLMEISA